MDEKGDYKDEDEDEGKPNDSEEERSQEQPHNSSYASTAKNLDRGKPINSLNELVVENLIDADDNEDEREQNVTEEEESEEERYDFSYAHLANILKRGHPIDNPKVDRSHSFLRLFNR